MYKVYILKSEKFSRYYIGHTKDLENRIEQQNKGKVKSTKAYRPWRLDYSEDFENKKDPWSRDGLFRFGHGALNINASLKNFSRAWIFRAK